MLIRKIKAGFAIYKAESHLDNGRYDSALSDFTTAKRLFGDSISRSHFFNLFLKIAECSYLLGQIEEGDSAVGTARQKIARAAHLNDEEKQYLSVYCDKLEHSAHNPNGRYPLPEGFTISSNIRRSIARDFPLLNWTKDSAELSG